MHSVERKSSGSAIHRVGPARENERQIRQPAYRNSTETIFGFLQDCSGQHLHVMRNQPDILSNIKRWWQSYTNLLDSTAWPCCSRRRRWTLYRYSWCIHEAPVQLPGHGKSWPLTQWQPVWPRTAASLVDASRSRWRDRWRVSARSRPCGTTWMLTWSSCGCHGDALSPMMASWGGSQAGRRAGCCRGGGYVGYDRRWVCMGLTCSAACCWSAPGAPGSPSDQCPAGCGPSSYTLMTATWCLDSGISESVISTNLWHGQINKNLQI